MRNQRGASGRAPPIDKRSRRPSRECSAFVATDHYGTMGLQERTPAMTIDFGRRELLIGAGAASIASLFPFPISARPLVFTASQTMTRFCWSLLTFNETMPEQLRGELKTRLNDAVEIAAAPGIERRRAECVAMITVRIFAARALRQAGYHDHATACETAGELEAAGRAAAIAQHSIGIAHRDVHLAGSAMCAYGIAAYGANAIGAATSIEDRWLEHAGDAAASALLGFEGAAEGDESEHRWIWSAAVGTIASCMSIDA
jgi:hypothetical protein